MQELMKRKRIWLLLLLPISLSLILIAKNNAYLVEYLFARGYYRYLSSLISRLTALVPFSISERILLISPFVIIFFFIRFVRKLIRHPSARKRTISIAVINVLATISVLVFLFTILCGVNYYRYDFSHYLNYDIDEYTVDDLYYVCKDLAYKANEIRERIEKEKGNDSDWLFDRRETAKVALHSFHELAKQYAVFENKYGSPKPLWSSKYLSYTQIVGIFSPFTMEANINVDVPAFSIPANTCHELAHMYGFMKEEEANYISYLACMNSGNDKFMYSGVLLALDYALIELREDYGKFVEIYRSFSDLVKRDMHTDAIYWSNAASNDYQQTIAEVSNTVNDAYLKSNGQVEGSNSYEKMVRYLVAEYRSRN